MTLRRSHHNCKLGLCVPEIQTDRCPEQNHLLGRVSDSIFSLPVLLMGICQQLWRTHSAIGSWSPIHCSTACLRSAFDRSPLVRPGKELCDRL